MEGCSMILSFRKLLPILLLASPALATDYYVRTDGNDANTDCPHGGRGLGQPFPLRHLDCRKPMPHPTGPITFLPQSPGQLRHAQGQRCSYLHLHQGSYNYLCDRLEWSSGRDWVRCMPAVVFNWRVVLLPGRPSPGFGLLGGRGYLGDLSGGTHFSM